MKLLFYLLVANFGKAPDTRPPNTQDLEEYPSLGGMNECKNYILTVV